MRSCAACWWALFIWLPCSCVEAEARSHTMDARYAHLIVSHTHLSPAPGFYQMVIVTASVRLLRLFRSCSNWKARPDDMPTDTRSRPRFFCMCGALPRSRVEI